MGRPTPTADDQATLVSEGTLSAAGQTTPATVFTGRFNLAIGGTFVGKVVIDRSFDGGVNWVPCTNLGGAVEFEGQASEILQNGERGVLFRARMSAWTSGSAVVRLSQ
jgi:hypothetical protein